MADAKKPAARAMRWGWLDQAIAYVSPRAGVQRYAAKASLGNLRRSYEGAARGRGTDGWIAPRTSADHEIKVAGPLLRDRMRDMVRNDPLAARALSVLVGSIIGAGIRPRAATSNKALNKRVDALFAAWAKQADATGGTDFFGLQALAFREMLEGGDVFALNRPRRAEDGLAVPLQIELLEADHLDDRKFDAKAGIITDGGIEFDAIGRRSAYWLYPDHPGASAIFSTLNRDSRRVQADRVAHMFERQRTQNRGVPWGTPAMRAHRDLSDWQQAEMERKKTEACLVGVVLGDESDQSVAPTMKDNTGREIEQFEPGMMFYSQGARDVKFNQPAATPGIREWNIVQQRIIAAGWRIPYELLTGDLSDVNFSSSRVGLNEWKRLVEVVQWHIVIPMFCQVVWDWVMDAAWRNLQIPRPDIEVEWAPPRFESVNPLQDATADILETRAGFATPQQQIAKRGYDPDQVMAEWAAFAAAADKANLIFDSDPRRVTNAGQFQRDGAASISSPKT